MAKVEPPTRAVVLAAGRGRRLRPYTDHTPKPLLPVRGLPTLDYVLKALAKAEVSEVCLVTHYLAEQIEGYVGDGSRWGVRTCFRRQPKLLGAAHALSIAAEFLREPTFVVAADYILPINYLRKLKVAYLGRGQALAVSLKQLPPSELATRSSVRFDEDGRIVEIVEKPSPGAGPSAIGASMIFIVPPAITAYLSRVPVSPRGEFELQTAINEMLRDGYGITGLVQSKPIEWSPGES